MNIRQSPNHGQKFPVRRQSTVQMQIILQADSHSAAHRNRNRHGHLLAEQIVGIIDHAQIEYL